MTSEEIRWRAWSKEAFREAEKENKLVLLDLSAVWCHWCHVMDNTTYSDRLVKKTINDSFVPVRVDIDERPDISERYNRGGFPTTAFLSDKGESIWGATYVPPADMRRIMSSILQAKASGDIERALEKVRMQYLDLDKAKQSVKSVGPAELNSFFEDTFSIYDIDFGGFGTQPKFPHPDVLDLFLLKYIGNRDEELSEAVRNTLDKMIDGIYDEVEGGLYRYSVSRDWKTPHYEKMLDTNIGFLRNLVHAHKILGEQSYVRHARGVADYILRTLWDSESGGFYASQDADEEYYKLTKKKRSKARAPAVDKRIFGGLNSEASAALAETGALIGEPKWVDAAEAAWGYSAKQLWNPQLGLIRHMKGSESYLFEDQVGFLESTLAVSEISKASERLEIASEVVSGVEKAFSHVDGGFADIIMSDDTVGELASTRRPLVANSRWARALALFGIATHDPSTTREAADVLRSFSANEVEAHGLFAAQYISSSWVLGLGPVLIEIHGGGEPEPLRNPLWVAAKKAMHPGALVLFSADSSKERFATICTESGCSKPIADHEELLNKVRASWASQV